MLELQAISVVVLSGSIAMTVFVDDPRTQFARTVEDRMPCIYQTEDVQLLIKSNKPGRTLRRLERKYPCDRSIRELRRIGRLTGFI